MGVLGYNLYYVLYKACISPISLFFPILFLIDMPSVHTLHPPGTTHLLPSHLVLVLPHPLTSPSLDLLHPAIGWSGWAVMAPKLTWLIKPP